MRMARTASRPGQKQNRLWLSLQRPLLLLAVNVLLSHSSCSLLIVSETEGRARTKSALERGQVGEQVTRERSPAGNRECRSSKNSLRKMHFLSSSVLAIKLPFLSKSQYRRPVHRPQGIRVMTRYGIGSRSVAQNFRPRLMYHRFAAGFAAFRIDLQRSELSSVHFRPETICHRSPQAGGERPGKT